MIKITIQVGEITATVEEQNGITLSNALLLIKQALQGAGYVFNGSLEIVEEI